MKHTIIHISLYLIHWYFALVFIGGGRLFFFYSLMFDDIALKEGEGLECNDRVGKYHMIGSCWCFRIPIVGLWAVWLRISVSPYYNTGAQNESQAPYSPQSSATGQTARNMGRATAHTVHTALRTDGRQPLNCFGFTNLTTTSNKTAITTTTSAPSMHN